jgi:hypothetical protein
LPHPKVIAAFGACILPHQQREIKTWLRSHQAKRRILDMLVTKKMLIVLTLVGALVGAGIGSLITHSATSTSAANTSAPPKTGYDNAQTTTTSSEKTPDQIAAENSSQFSTTQEQTAYRQGFDQGYSTCTTAANTKAGTSLASDTASTSRTSTRRYSNSRRAYYDYGTAPRGRTFWQKHRDKLTVAMGTGGGALIGGLIGGKRGAGIGMLAGGGSSALYTYKLRKRTRRY